MSPAIGTRTGERNRVPGPQEALPARREEAQLECLVEMSSQAETSFTTLAEHYLRSCRRRLGLSFQ